MMKSAPTSKIIGKAILLASIQSAIGSVEMSSRYSVLNFSKDQETLQRAADALSGYLIVSTFWTIGASLSLYSSYGNKGLFWGVFFNSLMIAWIWLSYHHSFKKAAEINHLELPKMFDF
jgi:hypothetical protein